MACVAFHSHILFVLLTVYINMTLFIFLSGKHILSLMTLNILNSTETVFFNDFQGLKLSISIFLHIFVIVFVFIAILLTIMDSLNFVSRGVTIVILLYSSLFNLIGCVLLFIYKKTTVEMSKGIAGCAVLSAITAATTFFFAVFFNLISSSYTSRERNAPPLAAPLPVVQEIAIPPPPPP
ncbi:unnamed protein product [Cylicocyclus nassatus]|uniref:Uncharacterized protein n=1 Tax=Cylicocyclus nassatus TaxID=53992 RepID=A0AA36H4S0_CYLNA|nr:unnamed protein product [Cylicocyclus nassatus]